MLSNYPAVFLFGYEDAIQFPFAKNTQSHQFLLSLSMETDCPGYLQHLTTC